MNWANVAAGVLLAVLVIGVLALFVYSTGSYLPIGSGGNSCSAGVAIPNDIKNMFC